MPIPWTLVWFGVLAPQNKALNWNYSGKSWKKFSNIMVENFFHEKKSRIRIKFNFYIKESDNLIFPERV